MQNADNFLLRCSQAGHIMPSDKPKSEWTETQIDKLIELYNAFYFSRTEEIKSKFLNKGNEREEDSVTLLSRCLRFAVFKNEKRFYNEYLSGMPDIIVKNADGSLQTIDTKTSWSKNTFDKARVKELNKIYYWQGQGYMALTGAKQHAVAYCLVNGTADAISNEKRYLSYKPGMLDSHGNETELFHEKCKQIEINHIFDLFAFKNENPHFEFHNNLYDWTFDIPMAERLHTFVFERNEVDIQRLYARVTAARAWMNANLFD